MMLQVKDLVVLYDKAVALQSVSLTIGAGEIVAIIGSNGAGKSTLLRAISGLVPIHTGEIWFGDVRVDGLAIQDIVARGIAHAPEGRRVFRDLSVEENLRMGAYLRNDKGIQADIQEIYTRLPRLAERKAQQAGSLSGGEQQMLAIGRALMSKPALLLLDEPSMGLSPLMTREVSRIIADINQQKKMSIILVEQNSQMALHVSHRAYVLEAGRVILEGDTTELSNNKYVKEAYLGAQ